VWGLAFKPQTDDLREAPAVTVIERLLERGAQVTVHDPRALDAARLVFGERVAMPPTRMRRWLGRTRW